MTIQFDYTNQAWVVDGRYERCGHTTCVFDTHGPTDNLDLLRERVARSCFGTRHVGERPLPDVELH